MFPLIRFMTRAFFQSYSLNDSASCKKFLTDLLALVKPLAAQTKTDLDDRLLQQLEYILKTDALFDYFYKLISDQFATDEIIFKEADEAEVTALLEQSTAEPLPEVINPILVVSLVTQIISLINAIKNVRL